MQPVDLQRLIQIIVEEVTAAQSAPAPSRCVCHSLLYECCPDRLRGVLDAGATRLGLHASGGAPGGVASMIDHTLLKPDATRRDIEALCREAAEYRFASVCVNPTWVALCSSLLQLSGVKVCSVVGFPLGATTPDTKHYETRRAIFDGAREIDMVINVGALKSGRLRVVERDISRSGAAWTEPGGGFDVIRPRCLCQRARGDLLVVGEQRRLDDHLAERPRFAAGNGHRFDIAFDHAQLVGFQRTDVDDHVDLTRTVKNRAPRLIVFRVGRRCAKWKSHHRTNLDSG